MPAARKGLFTVPVTLGVLIALVLAFVPRRASLPPGKLVVHYVTTNSAGAPMALLELFLYKPAWARFDAIEIKAVSDWQRMHDVPSNVLTQVNGLCKVMLSGQQSGAHKADWIVFPTNSNWRLRLEVVQARTGFGGLVDRGLYGRSHYKAGGWSNIVHGTRPVPYVGRSWRIESEEIRLP
jgi:hypothetical protein